MRNTSILRHMCTGEYTAIQLKCQSGAPGSAGRCFCVWWVNSGGMILDLQSLIDTKKAIRADLLGALGTFSAASALAMTAIARAVNENGATATADMLEDLAQQLELQAAA
jgi:hypothetical protein